MPRHLENYLRTLRKRAGLSQEEVALLLGCADGSKVSRYERFVRRPTLATALAYEALFDVPVRELFAGIYEEARAALQQRARLLADRLEKQPRAALARKRQFLDPLVPRDALYPTK